uniref:ABC transporter domain-containing protein n=1 Tax=Bigelowiella natans TaxID=227086 RepID=A0A7S2KMG4_BIGNA|mmetsp:Transcript_786/g.1189  ORF Transcript_786/g.1189 Transcript_786/m.1189 type:complete len:395 (+) Transcript_786:38-1222(+)
MGKKKSAKQRKIDAAKAKKKAELEAKRNKKKVILKKVETKDSYRSVTGVLTSRKLARDIKIGSFSLISWGNELIMDTNIELTIGRRYGLIGRNGSGKSEFLKCIANREVPIPDWVDLFLLSEEQKPTEFTGMEIVISKAEKEVERLEKLSEEILEEEGPDSPTLQDIYDRIETLDPSTFKARAGRILRGLGFGDEMMGKATKDMSGGWRMRVSLAEALFIKPALMLLDEPTNHLDLESCVWLEQYLATECENQCLVLVSHSQDFLNGVCTNICHITPKKTLKYYGGNYDTFMQVKAEVEVNQMKQYEKQQADIKKIKQFIASAGTYANLVKQAKSKQKILDKMKADGLIEKPEKERLFQFDFPQCDRLPNPVLALNDVGFAYSGEMKDALYKKS